MVRKFVTITIVMQARDPYRKECKEHAYEIYKRFIFSDKSMFGFNNICGVHAGDNRV